jgi:hypothetical protein
MYKQAELVSSTENINYNIGKTLIKSLIISIRTKKCSIKNKLSLFQLGCFYYILMQRLVHKHFLFFFVQKALN